MGHFGDSENDCIVEEITQADTLPCAMYPLFIKYDRGYYKPACNPTQNMVYVKYMGGNYYVYPICL